MNKTVRNNDVFYNLYWSRLIEYDRIEATRILPELPGIIWIQHKTRGRMDTDMFYACWRDGCRVGLKKLLDDIFTEHDEIRKKLLENDLFYRYAIVDTSPRDMQDIMFWLMKEHKPKFNDTENYSDSKRYRNIYIKEIDQGKDSIGDRR